MLRPSDAHLWVRCPLAGQMLASGAYPATHDPETDTERSDAQREGECAHWVAEICLRDPDESPLELIGDTHPNGWVVDAEMADHVSAYIEYVRSFGEPTASEQPVELFGLMHGRLDTVVCDSGPVVRVFDLKYGWKPVEATENYTMLSYGLSVWSRFPNGQSIELHIYQPRPSHPEGIARVWKIPADEVATLAVWLEMRARACFEQPRGMPGSQCLVCPARGPCHALSASVYAAYETIADDRMIDHSPAALGAFLTFVNRAEDMIRAKLSGLEAEATARIKRGQQVPGWTVDHRFGHRKFTIPRERVKLATGIDPVKTVPMSPAEMECAGVPKNVMNTISQRPVIGRKLTNQPVNLADKLFGKPEGK